MLHDSCAFAQTGATLTAGAVYHASGLGATSQLDDVAVCCGHSCTPAGCALAVDSLEELLELLQSTALESVDVWAARCCLTQPAS